MNLLLKKFATLAAALLLSLPTGWCCGLFSPLGETSAVAACCQAKLPTVPLETAPLETAPDESGSAPGRSVEECCCSHEAFLPSERVTPPEFSTLTIFPAVIAAPLNFSAWPAIDALSTAACSPLRLHLLQCVWRC